MIFVTGGTGLVGSHLLLNLTEEDTPITAIYRSESRLDKVRQLFRYYLGENAENHFQKIKWEKADIMDIPRLNDLMDNHHYVYHCAAIVSFARRDFNKLIQINRYGTANVVNACLHHNVKKLCYVSSTAAVGNKDVPENELVNESGSWVLTDETSGYSISKYSAEKEVWRGIEEGLNAVIVNPSIVFGAGDWNESSLVIFNTIRKGLRFYSPGANAFVDARDVASIMISLMESEISNERFLCVSENTSFKKVFTLIANQLNKKPPRYPVSPILLAIAWRIAVFWSVITFSSPTITKSSATSAFKTIKYSNKKLRDALDYNFISLEESINNAIQGRIG